MGLDMYLTANISLGKYQDPELVKKGEKIRKILPDIFKSGNLDTLEVSFEVGYWRKANAIHNWFVKNCQDGEDKCLAHYVSRKQLELLKAICQEELNAKDRPEESEGELEPTKGFFFGTYEKDEWYYQALDETIEIINRCLKLPEEWSFEYRSSW